MLRKLFVLPEAFLGQIGGDDFIAILNHHEYKHISEEVISGFEEMKKTFYNEHDWHPQYVLGEGRSGLTPNR